MAKAPVRKKTTRKQTSKRDQKPALPQWLVFLSGTLCGLFIAFLINLAGITPSSPQIASDTTAKKTTDKKPTVKEKSVEKPSKPTFDFYTILPENEVSVPDQPIKTEQTPIIYILQAGSFRSAADADKVKAKITLMGMNVTIDPSTNSSGVTWYRILVGPYSSHSKMEKDRSVLISNGMDVLMLKRKG